MSTVGLGDDYNEDVMASIAEASGANYYYVKDAEKLPGVLEQELGQVKNAVAQDLVIIVGSAGWRGADRDRVDAGGAFRGEQQATVHLGSFYASQRRDILVRCRVKSPQGESAENWPRAYQLQRAGEWQQVRVRRIGGSEIH